MPDSRSNRNINPHNDRIMQLEKQIDGLTVTIEGRAGTELVFAGHGEYPDDWEAYWIDEPKIVDVHNGSYDVALTPDEEIEILDNLDINDFVC
jgi:hypothetical protein